MYSDNILKIIDKMNDINYEIEMLYQDVSAENRKYEESLPDKIGYFDDIPEPQEDYEEMIDLLRAMQGDLEDIIKYAERISRKWNNIRWY